MKIHRHDDGDVTVFRLAGNFTGGEKIYDDFEHAIDRLIEENRWHLVLSFAGVKWINSPGIGIIMRNYAHYVRAGGDVVVADLNSRISIVFDLMIQKIFETFGSTDAAVEIVKRRLAERELEASAT